MNYDENKFKSSFTYSFYQAHVFGEYTQPEKQSFDVGNDTNARRTPIKIEEYSRHKNYILYTIYYDEKINKTGYFTKYDTAQSEVVSYDIDSMYIPHKFEAYYFKSESIVLFNISYKIAKSFLNEIGGFVKNGKSTNYNVKVQEFQFDLDKQLNIWDIKGMWLGFENKPNLNSSGMFGRDVNKDLNVNNLQKSGGVTTALVINYIFNNMPLTLTVSKNSSISIRTSIGKDESLELVINIISEILPNIK